MPPTAYPRRPAGSILAIVAGFLAVAVLSLGTDQIFHLLGVYPPWGEPMFDPGLNCLVLSYRIVYTLAGGYITARLAPHAPMYHVCILGMIGTCFATMGAVASIPMEIAPAWMPIALAVSAFPLTWMGGSLAVRTMGEPA